MQVFSCDRRGDHDGSVADAATSGE